MAPPPFHKRKDWGARAPESVTRWNPDALFGITVHWFGIPAAALSHGLCDDLLRSVQRSHQAGEFNDIAYNDGFCPHGHAYELRGLTTQTGANGTNFANQHYAAIVYMAGQRGSASSMRVLASMSLDQAISESGDACLIANVAAAHFADENGVLDKMEEDEAKALEAYGLGAAGVVADPFPEIAQDAAGFLLNRWIKAGAGRDVVPHQKWTGSSCPGPRVIPWVTSERWQADLPSPRRVQYFLIDDKKVLAKSLRVPITKSRDRHDRFICSKAVRERSHKAMAGEAKRRGEKGNVTIVRKVT